MVAGTVTEVTYDFIYPQYEGQDPESNPLAGTGRTPTDEELKDAIPVTLYAVDVDAVAPGTYAGEEQADIEVLETVKPGALISVQQAGGYNADGRQVIVNGMEEIAPGTPVVFFLEHRHSSDVSDPFLVVGVDFGQFVADESGTYICAANNDDEGTALTLGGTELSELMASAD